MNSMKGREIKNLELGEILREYMTKKYCTIKKISLSKETSSHNGESL